MTVNRTHYDVLSIERAATEADIRRSWKMLVQVWHPDRFTGEMQIEAERSTARINEAYHALRDPARRSAYDRKLQADEDFESRVAREAARSSRPRASFTAYQSSRRYESAPNHYESIAHHNAAPALTVVENLNAFAREIWAAAQRYPRVTVTVGVIWSAVFASAVITQISSGPSLPNENLSVLSPPPAQVQAAAAHPDIEVPEAAPEPTGESTQPEPKLLQGPPAPEPATPAPSPEPDYSTQAVEPDPFVDPPQPRHVIRIHPKTVSARIPQR